MFSGQSYGFRGGGMAEYSIKTPNLIEPVPENVSSEEACLAEPLATGVGSVNAADLGLGKSAVIIGAGKIGLGAMLAARANGVAPIIMVDLVKSRLDKALEIADYIRRHGPFQPHLLDMDDLEYTTLPTVLKKLEPRLEKLPKSETKSFTKR